MFIKNLSLTIRCNSDQEQHLTQYNVERKDNIGMLLFSKTLSFYSAYQLLQDCTTAHMERWRIIYIILGTAGGLSSMAA